MARDPELARTLRGVSPKMEPRERERTLQALSSYVQNLPEAKDLPAEARPDLHEALDALRTLISQVGRIEHLAILEMMALGKLGKFEEAISLARGFFADAPTWTNAVAAANALRRAGDLPGAIAMFREAARLDPQDASAWLDIGDLELDQGRPAEALAAYAEATAREADQPWAEVSSWYCRYLLTGESQWLDRLRELAAAPPDECGVADALAQLMGGYTESHKQARAQVLLARVREA